MAALQFVQLEPRQELRKPADIRSILILGADDGGGQLQYICGVRPLADCTAGVDRETWGTGNATSPGIRLPAHRINRC